MEFEFIVDKPPDLPRSLLYTSRPSWDTLAAEIHELFNIPVETVQVSYVAGGRQLVLNTERELQGFYRKTGEETIYNFSVVDPPRIEKPADAEALATMSRWQNRRADHLPPLQALPAYLHAELSEEQKIPITSRDFAQWIGSTGIGLDSNNTCTSDDVRRLFRDAGHKSRTGLFFTAFRTITKRSPDSETEDGFHHFWDENIREMLEMLLPDGKSKRNTNNEYRPDYSFHLLNACPLRGEEKSPTNREDPKAELAQKLAMPWPYPPAPYVFGYYATGPDLKLAAIHPSTDSNTAAVSDLAYFNLRLPKRRIELMVALINLAPLCRAIAELVKAPDIEFEPLEGKGCTVEIAGSTIIKTFTGFTAQEEFTHVTQIYSLLKDKRVPGTDAILTSKALQLYLHPRSIARRPANERELVQAVACVLQMLEVLHRAPGLVHRDLRWPNIMHRLDKPQEWFVIDWTDAAMSPAPATTQLSVDNHSPRVFEDDHGTEVDLWGVGHLLFTSGLYGISSWFHDFGRSLQQYPHHPTATEALSQLQQQWSSLLNIAEDRDSERPGLEGSQSGGHQQMEDDGVLGGHEREKEGRRRSPGRFCPKAC
ncbi:hypothetical protein C8F01DRAFT_1117863 [Mycena amicta]|nr:hypothetical protein C8F01DRAFT_1117863 [Mycena amicta]